eukprot:scaffold21991_cov33-Tisochrysis_lutea.AAC.3
MPPPLPPLPEPARSSSRPDAKPKSRPHNTQTRGMYSAVVDTLAQWRPVLLQPELRRVVALHGAYWACMAGVLHATASLAPLPTPRA